MQSFCLQGNGIDRADTAGCNGRGWCEDVSYTLNTIDRPAVYTAGFDGNMGAKAGNIGYEIEKAPTLNAGKVMSVCAGFKGGQSDGGIGYEEEKAPTLSATPSALEPTILCLNDQGGSVMNVSEKVAGALRAEEHGHQPAVFEAYQHHGYRESETAGMLTAGQNESIRGDTPLVYENHGQDCRYKQLENVSETISAKYGEGGNNQPLVLSIGNGQTDAACCSNADVAHTLNCMHDPLAVCISGTYQDKTGTLSPGGHPGSYNGQDAYNDMLITSVDCRNASEDPNINATLQANPKTVNNNNVCRIGSQVRRLTPLECERLQGFPDGWTDIGEWVDSKGKKHKESDSPRYKALGNSIAVGYANNGSGFWMWLLKRISAQYERNATLGSLFDGIGGFPLAWEHFNGKGSARWASEIEEFPIAVTKKHFPED